jgi:dUTP pyrophosphatase
MAPVDRTLEIHVQCLPNLEGLGMPEYATEGSAGLDLVAAVDGPLTIDPAERVLIATGIALAIPVGFEGQVRPRSGLASAHGITVLNAPGTIDSDYRGEIKVLLINLGTQRYSIEPGERIAQLVVSPVETAHLVQVSNLTSTNRADGGFGHTDEIT